VDVYLGVGDGVEAVDVRSRSVEQQVGLGGGDEVSQLIVAARVSLRLRMQCASVRLTRWGFW
jgi:hypothetical protein